MVYFCFSYTTAFLYQALRAYHANVAGREKLGDGGRVQTAITWNAPVRSELITECSPRILLSQVYIFPELLNIRTSVNLTPALGTPFLIAALLLSLRPAYVDNI